MPHRLILYDALRSMAAGNLLVKIGDMSTGMYLHNVGEVSIVFERMVREGYIAPLPEEETDNEDGSIQWYTLTAEGRRVLDEGHAWYRSLPLWWKILGRLGFPIPW